LFDLEIYKFSIAAFCSFLLGVSKAGIKGIAALIVTGFALAFGAKASTGILMPLLLLGDIFAVSYYKGFVKWNYIIKLLPMDDFGCTNWSNWGWFNIRNYF